MNHVNAMTGTVLGGAAMCLDDDCAHWAEAVRKEGALATFVSGLAAHRLPRPGHHVEG